MTRREYKDGEITIDKMGCVRIYTRFGYLRVDQPVFHDRTQEETKGWRTGNEEFVMTTDTLVSIIRQAHKMKDAVEI
jgi:hypothetical protein